MAHASTPSCVVTEETPTRNDLGTDGGAVLKDEVAEGLATTDEQILTRP